MSQQQLIDHVRAMRSQGLSDSQIIQALQRDGHNSTTIFEVINQASSAPSPSSSPASHSFQSPSTPSQPAPPPSPHPQSTVPPHNPSQSNPVPPPGNNHEIEEMVEAVIDEKWNELVKDITMIIEWKNQTQTTIVSLEQQFTDLKDQFDKLHHAIVSKISEYDKNILDVGAEIKAMEKVFSKVLPLFTQNVGELSRITQDLKGHQQQ